MKKIILISISLFMAIFFAECVNSQSRPPTSKNKAMQNLDKKHTNNPYYSHTDTNKLHVSLSEWKKILPPEVYHTAFEKGTDLPFQGKYYKFDTKGTYYCAVCGNKLFRSTSKFASSCGWPSFFEPSRKDAVIYLDDHSHGMSRTEVECARCGAHLGHVFKDGPPPTGLRYCMDSSVLDFIPDSDSSKTAK